MACAVVASAGPLVVAPHAVGAADLAAAVSVDRTSLVAGERLTLTATFRNVGTEAVGEWRARLWVEVAPGFSRQISFVAPAVVTPAGQGSVLDCTPDLGGELQCAGRGFPPGATATVVTTWSARYVSSPVMSAVVLGDRRSQANNGASVLVQINPPPGAPNLELVDTRSSVVWRRSVPRGAVVVTAATSLAARIEVALLQRGRAIVRRLVDVPAGQFSVRLPVPRGLLPGPHVLRLLDRGGLQVGTPVLPIRAIPFDIPGPRGGIADAANISGVANGPAAETLSRRARIFASFHLAVLPARGQRLRTVWYLGSRRVGAPRGRPRSATVGAFLEASGGGLLPVGRYRCDLLAGSQVIASASVRLR